MNSAFHFSLNRMSAPRLPFDQYVSLCKRLGIDTIEIRNDLDGVETRNGASPDEIRATVEQAGLKILTINALQRFEQADRSGRAVSVLISTLQGNTVFASMG